MDPGPETELLRATGSGDKTDLDLLSYGISRTITEARKQVPGQEDCLAVWQNDENGSDSWK